MRTLCLIPFRGTPQCKTRLKINDIIAPTVEQLVKSLFLEDYRCLSPFFTETIILTKGKTLIQDWLPNQKPRICEDLAPTLNGALEEVIKIETENFDYLTIVLPDLPLLSIQDVIYLLDQVFTKKYLGIIGRSKDNGTNMFSISSNLNSKISLKFGKNSFFSHKDQFKPGELLQLQEGWTFDLDVPQDVVDIVTNSFLFNQLSPSLQKLANQYVHLLSDFSPESLSVSVFRRK